MGVGRETLPGPYLLEVSAFFFLRQHSHLHCISLFSLVDFAIVTAKETGYLIE